MVTAEFKHVELYGGAITANLPVGFDDVRWALKDARCIIVLS